MENMTGLSVGANFNAIISKASMPEYEHREIHRALGADEKIMSPKTIRGETGASES